MAVAEARKMEKDEGGGTGSVTARSWLTGPLGWGPRKLAELRTFFSEVKSELKKVTWPGRQEVQATTLVVILTTVFFGFYLYGLDLLMFQIFSRILKHG
jgi:preprotein translocase subunit SecE